MNLAEWFGRLSFWPDHISDHAVGVDNVLIAFTIVMVLFTAPVFIAMTWFAIRYRKGSRASRAGRPRGSPWIETAWAAIPLAVMTIFFVRAAESYIGLNVDRPGALQIDVVAKQWMWKTQHPTGRRQINQLNVPVDTPVELTMISQDVIHSMFLPALRIKQDVLPGRYTKLRFMARRTGTYHLTCAEYCGTLHSRMGGSLVVMEKEAYESWAERSPPSLSAAERGRRLFADLQCGSCHGPDAPVAAPELDGSPHRIVALSDGEAVQADDAYLRDSILRPNRQVVAGFEPTMPSYGKELEEMELRALIAYMRSLSGGERHE